MKLSKKLEAEVLEVYEAYWYGLLNVDMKTYAATLDKDFKLIGSTEAEMFFKKMEAVRFLEATADQVAGNIEMRNRIIKVEPVDTLMLITEQCDAYVKIDGAWAFYGKGRGSSLLQKKEKGWKFIQMHISFPDNRTEEGETIALEQIKAETLQLRDAVKRRTIELENKTRDLEIEASLERVRAVAMSMRKPDDLPGICEVLFAELTSLGFTEMRNAMINIHDDEHASFINYDYSDEIGQSINHLRYDIHPVIEKQIRQMRSAGDAFSETYFKGKDLQDWKAFRKNIGEKDDPRIDSADALYYYFYSIGTGSIGISTFGVITDGKLNVLKRFRNVFEFAYRRYMDVAQAEAQAQEAQIELGLERVRARAMAMQNSDELSGLVATLFEELTKLNLILYRCIIWIFDPATFAARVWMANSEDKKSAESYFIKRLDHPYYEAIINEWKERSLKWVYHLDGNNKKSIDELLLTETELAHLPDAVKAGILSSTHTVVSGSFNNFGLIEASGPIQQSDEQLEILSRFGKVFDLTYTRFNDLKQAEAQSREAQIELGLERVRARAMAMQKSEELGELVDTVFKELTKLHFLLDRCIIMIFDPKTNGATWWLANPEPGSVPVGLFVKYHQHKPNLDYIKAWQARTLKWEYLLEGPNKKEWDKFLFAETDLSLLPDVVVKGMTSFERIFLNVSFNNFGCLTVSTIEPLQEEYFDILLRFAKVFDTTYTRFNDLQKAEAQSREAQIELALERVRARTMAMQRSDELQVAASVMVQQIQTLGVPQFGSGFNIWDDDRKAATAWMCNVTTDNLPPPFKTSSSEDIFLDIHDAAQRGELLFVKEQAGKELETHYRYMNSIPIFKEYVESASPEGLVLPEFQIMHCAFFSQGYLMFITYEPVPVAHDIFKRFAKVFEQTYTRFLDLQTAEAQAREAQIQLALERVRARTMAMQHSDELADASHVLERQAAALGLKTWSCAFHIFRENDSLEYHSNADGVKPTYVTPRTYIWQRYYEACQRGETLIIEERAGEACTELYEYMAAMPIVGEELQKMKAAGIPFPTYQVEHAASFKYGYLLFITFEPVPEAHHIFKRFAKVFEQTYTRFLDLQKAEAQAREAQIEVALEKIRSRSLAMHHSDELKEVMSVMFKKLTELEILIGTVGILLFDEKTKNCDFWLQNQHQEPGIARLPYDEKMMNEDNYMRDYWDAKTKGESFFNKKQTIEQKNRHFEYVFAHNDIPQSVQEYLLQAQHHTQTFIIEKNSALLVDSWDERIYSMEQIEVLKRVAKVFEQAYIRFLDLQKAETQSREAQIELALERVRARTMAMQHSEELMEAANLLFQQVLALGIPIWSCGFNIWEKGEKFCTGWMSTQGVIQPSFRIPLTEGHTFVHMNESRLKGEPFYVEEMGGEALAEHYRNMFNLPDFKAIADEQLKDGFTLPKFQINHVFNFRHGNLIFLSGESIPEAWDIFKRFTAVFEQTYTRFLDLQKAEVQSREAQIELALERVRARAMAMQSSDELIHVANVMREQMGLLGQHEIETMAIHLYEDEKEIFDSWYAFRPGRQTTGKIITGTASFRNNSCELIREIINGYKSRATEYTLEASGAKLKEWFAVLAQAAPVITENMSNDFIEKGYFHFTDFSGGSMVMVSYLPPTDETKLLQKRCTVVFDLAYRRFLDLQKAEANAKEAQIELALERVRAKTMAMHNSSELIETAELLFDQLKLLGAESSGVAFSICEHDTVMVKKWTSIGVFSVPYTIESGEQRMYEAWKNQIGLYEEVYEGERLLEYIELFKQIPEFRAGFQKFLESGHPFSTWQKNHAITFKYGYLLLITSKPFEDTQIFIRFAKVFEQTYTRFLDLQKAEAQAREAQIQLALERVRARTMAMQKSDELAETVFILFQQFKQLGENPDQATIGIINEDERVIEYWVTMYGNQTKRVYKFSIDEPNVTNRIYNAWKEQKKSLVIDLSGQALYDFATYRESMGGAAYNPEEKQRVINVAFFSKGIINVQSNESRSTESIRLLERFAGVFEQTYTRFLDLKKVEAQAKEAKIEASLERVRAQAMSIRKSEELAGVGEAIFTELNTLGFNDLRNTEILINNNTKESIFSYYYSDYGVTGIIEVFYKDHPTVKSWAEEMQKANDAFAAIEISENEIDAWRKYREEIGYQPDPKLNAAKSVFYYSYSTGLGALSISSFTAVSEEQIKILERFRNVFGLAYRRYADVAHAEAQAREAKIEAALERTRTQSMIMQHSKELDDTLRVFHEQVLLLGINSAFSFLWLPDEENDKHKFWAVWAEYQQGIDADKQHATIFKSKAIDYPLDRNEPATAQCLIDWKSGEPVYSYAVPPEGVKNYFAAWQELIDGVEKLTPQHFTGGLYYVEAFIKYGCFGVMLKNDLTTDEKKILARFAIEFERTYTRFLDLQKAEAQAKEAQIQLALERVRARTMAMHHSDELKDAAILLFEQMKALGVHTGSCGFNIWNKKEKTATVWMSSAEGGLQAPFKMPHAESVIYKQVLEAIERGENFLVKEVGGKTLEKHFDYLLTLPGIGDVIKQLRETGYVFPETMVYHFAFFNNGYLSFHLHEHHPETHDIFKRFAKVFEQTYTRFLDLQKAEAQAREAQIEAALEKIRSRSLAMHKSEELKDVVAVLFEKLRELGLGFDGTGIQLFTEGSKDSVLWIRGVILSAPVLVNHPYDEEAFTNSEILRDIWLAKEKAMPVFNKTYSFEEKNKLVEYTGKYNKGNGVPPEVVEAMMQAAGYTATFIVEKNSGLWIDSWYGKQITAEEFNLAKRVAKVFEQAYIRFLDLQKAEAQAREATIEAALERVRSRSMGMQKSEELREVIQVIYEQLQHLNFQIITAGFLMDYRDTNDFNVWLADPYQTYKNIVHYPYFDHPIYNRLIEAKEKGLDFLVNSLTFEEKNQFVDHVCKYLPAMPTEMEELKKALYSSKGYVVSNALMKNVALFIENYDGIPFSDAENATLVRFAKVFEQTYIRFNDLKQAEAQAREAQIEAALERVRSRTLAMHKSDELAETAVVLFQQLIGLGIEPNRLYIGIIKDESGDMEMWATDEDGTRVGTKFIFIKKDNDSVKKLYDGWQAKKKSVVVDMQGKELEEYLHYLNSVMHIPFKGGLNQKRRVQSVAYFSQGFIGMASPDEQTEESIQLLERFASVFNLTYTRFNDLQHAETQTHKAQIEVALERVRARALAMQQPEELVEVAEVLRHEMGLLGVEELETSSIYIHDENSDKAECWYAIKDIRVPEKKLIADHITIALTETWVGREMLGFYNSNKKQISIPMLGTNRREWIEYCSKVSTKLGGFYGETIPDRTYHLYKFSNGAIAAATPGNISAESWELLQRTASVFSLAYSRFKDLTQARFDLQLLKAEKQRAEEALTELQATQKQLIQSEKMASLGELTAGIAHEIQNPLNFVNNFSEVSKELLDEMKTELDNGNMVDAKDIANDVIQNLEKINHHGKRADAIVKGMLQHSQSRTGVKEPTNINALADEYFRLAYHGLRAKDKLFNATLQTDYDESIGNINITPQDIGRVILNLITNAFYAVNEKNTSTGLPAGQAGSVLNEKMYEPTVTVSTKKLNDTVEIKVKDNGNGIPKNVVDKVFQPFFTTKPTGQGTGLGLSLAYDIVKAHGGEITVETKEGEGAEFIINLNI